MADRRINLRVHSVTDGSKQLVFEDATTRECVGEIRVLAKDAGYLPVMATLFERWVKTAGRGPALITSPVAAAVDRALNGH